MLQNIAREIDRQEKVKNMDDINIHDMELIILDDEYLLQLLNEAFDK